MAEVIAENVFLFIAWIVLTFYPDWIAVISIKDPEITRIPLFQVEALRPYVIAVSFLWLFQFILNLYLIRASRKTKGTRLLEILLSLGGLAIFLVATQDESLINHEALSVLPDSLMDLSGTGLRLLILLIVILTLFEAGKNVFYMVKSK